MLNITPIPAFDDNYIWLLQYGRHVIVIDPGDATPVIKKLLDNDLSLSAILVTHHHHDHIGGVQALLNHQNAPVYAPIYRDYPFKNTPVQEGDSLNFPELNLKLNVMWLPGHTLDHVAYVNDAMLFCGDVLFSAGCGRLFEGSANQLLTSLNRLKHLDPSTHVYCTHEYTTKNIAFALTLDPDNMALAKRQREVISLRNQDIPSLPSTIGLELAINPFLRCNEPAIIHHAHANSPQEIDVFSAIRTMRNAY